VEPRASSADVERVFRAEHGRAVAALAKAFGDLDVAEEAVADAFALALERWPGDGVPPSPAGWIVATAKNRAIDRLRREATRADRHARAEALRARGEPEAMETDAVPDERLRLIFTCCHPALGRAAQIALTLRLLGGLSTPEIARAFLLPEATMAQRLVRAKGKIRDAGIPYRVPEAAELPARLASVLAVVYLVFNEGYASTAGPALVREDLCAEAVRLARVLVSLVPEETEARGLLALMLLAQSRRPARTGAAGELVPLAEQDRARWDRALAAEGVALVRACLARGDAGPYAIQAAIQAVHAEARDAASTDWPRIVRFYDALVAIDPSPIVALNRAVAVAEVEGLAAALALVDALEKCLAGYHLLHAIRADLLRRMGRGAEATAAYEKAIALTENEAEREFLRERRAAVSGA